ncbi:DUF3325 domain-containing protein [Massilia atriviolacea]|uniref:DUF3325 domain-containing protein n=1 Tax=Massilia atriviolacea TaxID=2495579 RepID=A0A430HTG5_9BURK|nr:DUF3325 domain-containing protein [Massilia atriviolacea]RSZ60797.1 DUF3325 domain-containing protein [Massilia atriviolacea]
MSGALYMVAVFALCHAGFGALSVAMDRHYADMHGRGQEPPPAVRQRLQAAGAAALALALAAAVLKAGGGHGPLVWLGGMTAAALALVLLLTYAPQRVARLAQAAGAVGAIAFALGALL